MGGASYFWENHLERRLLDKGGLVSPHSTKHVQQITATGWRCDDANDLWQFLSQSVHPSRDTSKDLSFSDHNFLQGIVCISDPVLMGSNVTEPQTWRFDQLFPSVPLLNSYICENDEWKRKGWSEDSLNIYWPVWEQRLMCGFTGFQQGSCESVRPGSSR